MLKNLTNIAGQCCDADQYLGLGYRCAQTGSCYDDLRPIGDGLWFSLPYRLGLGADCLVLLQFLMVGLVAITAWQLFRRIVRRAAYQRLGWLAGMLALAMILRPTFFHTLADTPATLFFVEGVLLALLGTSQAKQRSWILASGLCLGAATLMRAAYMQPVCLAGIVLLFSYLLRCAQAKQWLADDSLFLFSFTLPMCLQFLLTWQHFEEWSFTPRYQNVIQRHDHLNSAVVGYDTLNVGTPFYWAPTCKVARGITGAIETRDMTGLSCLLAQRAQFYFGSYALETFEGNQQKNFLGSTIAEHIGIPPDWQLVQASSEANVAPTPAQDNHASRITLLASQSTTFIEASTTAPLAPGNYVFSTWLWTENPAMTLDIMAANKTLSARTGDWDYNQANADSVTLNHTPTLYTLQYRQNETGYVAIRLGHFAADSSAATPPSFLAWGAALQQGEHTEGYVRNTHPLFSPLGTPPAISGHARIFSVFLLGANILAGFGTAVFLWKQYQWTRNTSVVKVGASIALLLIEGMLILPEQRFMQPVLACIWLFAAPGLLNLVTPHTNNIILERHVA